LGAPFSSPTGLRLVRVVEVLETISTAEARTLLEKLAQGAPHDPLARQARSALDRLAARPAGSSPGPRAD
jgi:hypothetical protein